MPNEMLIDADVIVVSPPPPRRTKRRLLWAGLAVALIAAAGTFAYRQIAADSAATFKTTAVTTGDIEKSVTALGALQPKDYVDVGAQVSGQLKKVHVEIGDRVKQGDLLAAIDPTVLETRTRTDRADLANLHAQLAEQEANLVLARQQVKRNQNLFKAKIVSQDTLQTAEAQVAAGEAKADSLRAQIDGAQATLDGDVANLGYFDAASLRQRLPIARENLEAARQVLRLVEIQMAQGAATALDLAQQRTAVATFEAQIPTLEQQLAADQTSLAILLGRAPGNTTVEKDKLDALTLPTIAAGQPADLLRCRPDIAQAEANLKAANADIGVARAAFYPSLTLSASAAISGLATSGASTAASLAAGLVAPIFEGGQLEGQLDLTKARKQELVATYRQTVLTSFKEAEDALSTVETSAARVKSLQTAADQAREAFRLAQLSYSAGASDFLTVLDAQRTLLDNEDSLVQAQRDRFTAAASLFKALGGGWAGSA